MMIRTFLLSLLLLLGAGGAAAQTNVSIMLENQTSTTTTCSASRAVNAKAWSPQRSFMASGTTSSGAGAATVVIYGSTVGTSSWVPLGTITLTLATSITFGTSTDGFSTSAPWPWLCAHVSAISGTGASVTVTGSAQ